MSGENEIKSDVKSEIKSDIKSEKSEVSEKFTPIAEIAKEKKIINEIQPSENIENMKEIKINTNTAVLPQKGKSDNGWIKWLALGGSIALGIALYYLFFKMRKALDDNSEIVTEYEESPEFFENLAEEIDNNE